MRLLLALALFAVPAAAQPPEAGDLPARMDAAVAPYLQAGDFSGVVAIRRDGEPAVVRAYGLASVELDRPHTPESVFQIGSVSKQFTAAAILLLEEEGRLRTNDPVGRHLPGFPHGEVTIEQLLTHTSGLTDVYALPLFGASEGRSGSFEAVLSALGEAPLTGAPGAGFAYSNGGYSVLAAVIEAASGQSYGVALKERLFEPLGMDHTAHDAPGPAVPNRVPGYDPWGPRSLAPAPLVAPAFTAGSGSLWSSAADLLIWAEALHTGRLLTPASYAKLTTDYGAGYGYGESVFTRFGRSVVGHDGRVSGYASDLALYPDDQTTIVVLSNVQSVARDDVRRAVAAAAFGLETEPPPTRSFAASPAEMDELEGAYAFGPGFRVTIVAREGRLLAQANEGGYSELVPLEGGGWFSRMLYATVRFGRDADGRVDRLIWGAGEGAPVGARAEGA